MADNGCGWNATPQTPEADQGVQCVHQNKGSDMWESLNAR